MGHPEEGAAAAQKFKEDEARRQATIDAFRTGGGGGGGSFFEDDEEEELDEFEPEFWQEALWGFVVDEAQGQAEALGITEWEFASIMGASRQSVWDWTARFMENITLGTSNDLEYMTSDPKGIRLLFANAWNRFRSINPVFGELSGFGPKPTSGRGSGSRGPTAQDIRNRYDIDELAMQTDNIWRNMLLTTNKGARSIAKGYVDEIVRTKGEKRIDFQTYVRARAMDSNRFAVIYENKPDELEPEEYLARYANAAAQILRPDNVEGAAITGARIGADAQSFAANLSRSDEVTGSAPFINGLENRMRGLNEVFRG